MVGSVLGILRNAAVGFIRGIIDILWFLTEDVGWEIRSRVRFGVRRIWDRVDDAYLAAGEWWGYHKMDVLGWIAVTLLAIGLPILVLVTTLLAIYYSARG